ncbi:glycosyltransferase family 2 protein [Sediminispirochaeta smaragdinae]|uniref:Glycosyl transferase family 2 n=1 Tax=Sediminispirochaeta smaragdinae (strain DSM 11293 / JCM 15392 / SEBR 4228) TaxID=573413 RepID=E1RBW8_SEDSS|nr:glycosyltransferase family 2 protein [Sediminispirochaeta smaragdinae]ADK79848.1 glycosyl transferase family 2 [Sediminispirochaeta smaragdinae DSM 11293]
MEDDLVSIITPLYNAEEFIAATARSVLAQSYEAYEWIVVDDGSGDDSVASLQKAVGDNEKVKIIKLPANKGPIAARNAGFEAARGRFIAFIDADDLWLPEKLELQVAAMKRSGAPLSCTGYKKITREGSLTTGITIPIPEYGSYRRLLHSDHICASSAMFDRSITGDIRQSHQAPVGRDDYHFFLSIVKAHGFVYGLKRDLVRFRVFSESLTGNKWKSAGLQWQLYRRTYGFSIFSSMEKFCVYAVKGFAKYLL